MFVSVSDHLFLLYTEKLNSLINCLILKFEPRIIETYFEMEFPNFHRIEQSILWAQWVHLDECVYPIHSGKIWMNMFTIQCT